jgi:histone deacetylase 1/2
MSTCAAEYVALSIATQNLANLKVVLDDVDPVSTYEILCDNQAAVLFASDNASCKKIRYLQRAFYFVNDFVRRNKVKLYWIPKSDQLADVFTKRLAVTKHREATSAINIVDIPSKFFPSP